MKWPIIFCILKTISIRILSLHIKKGIKFKYSRSLWKKNGIKVIKIEQVMIIWNHTWKNGDSSRGLVIFLLHKVSSTWKLLGTFEVIFDNPFKRRMSLESLKNSKRWARYTYLKFKTLALISRKFFEALWQFWTTFLYQQFCFVNRICWG